MLNGPTPGSLLASMLHAPDVPAGLATSVTLPSAARSIVTQQSGQSIPPNIEKDLMLAPVMVASVFWGATAGWEWHGWMGEAVFDQIWYLKGVVYIQSACSANTSSKAP